MRRAVVLTGLLAIVPSLARPAERHPFGVRDLVALDRISEPAVSPDARRVAFTSSRVDLDANRRRTDLWIVGSDGAGARRLTAHEASDASAAWSPDGRWVYFLSTRSGSSQVFRIPADGGEAEAVTRLPLDVGSFRLSPDGSLLAVSLEVFPECGELGCTTKRLAEAEGRKASGRLYDRLFVRHWDTWQDGRRSHLFAVPASGGEAVDLMKGMDADAPSKPFGGAEEFAFTPDGRALVFAARDAGREEAWSTNFDLFLAPVDASAPPRNLTAANRAWDTGPVFSPDGRTLAYRAMVRPGFESDRYRIVVRPWPDGKERVLTEAWDRSPDEIAWSSDGRTLFAVADNLGHKSLFAVDVVTGAVRTVVKDGTVAGVQPTGDRIVFGLDHLRSPVDLHSVKADGTGLRAITSANAERLAAVALGEPEPFTFAGWNGETVHGWIVKPAAFDPSKKYPVAFLVHGGPQGSMGNHFHYRWNPQTYAGAGYAAVMVDFHGSTGYGQAFTDAITGHWGDRPLEDLQKGLEAALQRSPWMDEGRVCALGASYGGFMINWIAGNWTDRFRCLVSHDGNLDERMAYFDTEELWFPEWEHGGTPWDAPAGYAKHNPIDHVAKWKTPMLVVHGARDYRVVDAQGLSTFTALQRRGIPSQLLHFPDENHWVLKPQNSILWHDTVLAWLDRWTGAEGK
ncbi:MAG: S9 family peptidase [Acidobacteria bacterium]|nr:S9 family peptidase [Acidobacteriota bacterium]